jgi:archaellum component FlaG (FlaF/FlaG flagellin family)
VAIFLKIFWSGVCLVILLSVAFATSTYAAYNTSKSVSSSGKVSTINVSVYKDSACTQAATDIDWGTLTPGSSTTYTLYIKNAGSAAETLSMSTSGWSPSTASQYITITWNRDNALLNANQVVQATLTVTVSSSITSDLTTFSNLITITGTM